ncbi:hypothetical protein MAR_028899 [Mya arenaria]|uniref:Uncharacterized protein n=1 Tax=Mya arenaria TaxID=6604 RepID=A0ABY7DEV6_MYAAR|nr:hypothetical protein MAR_028899 [Mya arenaria]
MFDKIIYWARVFCCFSNCLFAAHRMFVCVIWLTLVEIIRCHGNTEVTERFQCGRHNFCERRGYDTCIGPPLVTSIDDSYCYPCRRLKHTCGKTDQQDGCDIYCNELLQQNSSMIPVQNTEQVRVSRRRDHKRRNPEPVVKYNPNRNHDIVENETDETMPLKVGGSTSDCSGNTVNISQTAPDDTSEHSANSVNIRLTPDETSECSANSMNIAQPIQDPQPPRRNVVYALNNSNKDEHHVRKEN